MGTAKVDFEIPEEILYSLNENVKEFTSHMRLITAMQLFKDHKLSFGKAVELSGFDKEHFLVELDKYNIPLIDYDPQELEEELLRLENDNHR